MLSRTDQSVDQSFGGEDYDGVFERSRHILVSFLTSIQTKHGSLDLAQATLEFCIALVKKMTGNTLKTILETFQKINSLISSLRVCGLPSPEPTSILLLDFVISNMILQTLYQIRTACDALEPTTQKLNDKVSSLIAHSFILTIPRNHCSSDCIYTERFSAELKSLL